MGLNIEDYECVLCLRLLYEPCTLRCGHSFCVRCCRDLANARHAKCPTCRRVLPLHGHPTDMAVSLSLARLLAASFPEAYANRKTEDAAEANLRVGDAAEPNSPARYARDVNGDMETTMPLFYLDPMLPRQRLQLNIFEPRYRLMVRRCLEGSRRFGMVGVEWLTPLRHMGQRNVRHGVEVEIVENSPQADGRFHIEVLAGRRFEIIGDTWEQDGYAMATVRWILPPSVRTPQSMQADVEDSAGPEGEAQPPPRSNSIGSEGLSVQENSAADMAITAAATETEAGLLATARREIGSNSVSVNDAACLEMAAALAALVEEWKELVATGRWERFRGQLGRNLADLGPMPTATNMDGVVERSLWVGALINPLPGLGVAMEVRPLLLAAGDSPHEMVQIATEGIRGSIAHMTPSPTALWVRRQLARLDWSTWRDSGGNANMFASLDWLWRFLSVAGVGGLLTVVFGTFVLVCLGVHRGFWYLLEAQDFTDAAADAQPVDLTHYTTRARPPPPPSLPTPSSMPRDEV